MLKYILIAACLVQMPCAVLAGPYEDGLAAYEHGDYATALKFWRSVAEQGHSVAQHNLGVMYDNGSGVPQDYAKAANWYRKAAEQGFVRAQYNLGAMYRHGIGIPLDYVRAHMWYSTVASSRYGQIARQVLDELVEKMTPEQIAEAERLAKQWLAKHPQ